MSKIDPTTLTTTTKLDRRSTLLLQAARQKAGFDEEKSTLSGFEDPGIDTLRGSFGTFGSIVRARSARRASQNNGRPPSNRRPPNIIHPYQRDLAPPDNDRHDALGGMKRHQLYDAPVPRRDTSTIGTRTPSPSGKRATIKFDTEDVVHKYDLPGSGVKHTTERRVAASSPAPAYPPLPSLPPHTEGLPPSSSHRNMDLLGISEVEEPDSSGSKNSRRQSLEFPASRFKAENEVQSAPPTVHQRFAAIMSGQSMFNDSPSQTSLLSFPSVTDSGPSENWEEDPELHARQQRQWEDERRATKERGREVEVRDKAGAKERERERSRLGKRYPAASEDDDREESISLFRSRGEDYESTESGTSPVEPSPGGVRLVQPKRPAMF